METETSSSKAPWSSK